MAFEISSARPYLNAHVEEALRIHLPIPDMLSRITLKGGNMILRRWVSLGMISNFDLELSESRSGTEHIVFMLWEKEPIMCKHRAVER
ncbi:hypothetical protein PG985_014931 [Apiospora marii]|uniref:Uncharacterized protein n=1 Tax=Apiospora marii TaxID=335849 RepID=A0ABR1RK31_9PEZI